VAGTTKGSALTPHAASLVKAVEALNTRVKAILTCT
jgi:hypothetical protein